MNMDPEQDDFLQLRRLLALKRHEQPPPGYFEHFSGNVIARVRAGEATAKFSLAEALSWDAPWLQKLLGIVQNRPVLAGGFGFAACSLLVAGLLFSEPNNAQELSGAPLTTAATAMAPQLHAGAGVIPAGYDGSATVTPVSDGVAPAGQLSGSIFQQLKQLPAHPELLSSPASPNLFR